MSFCETSIVENFQLIIVGRGYSVIENEISKKNSIILKSYESSRELLIYKAPQNREKFFQKETDKHYF